MCCGGGRGWWMGWVVFDVCMLCVVIISPCSSVRIGDIAIPFIRDGWTREGYGGVM